METALSRPSEYQACNPAYSPAETPSAVDHCSALEHTTHVSLEVTREPSSSGQFPVTVINGSTGQTVRLMAQGMGTIRQLKNQLNGEGAPEWNAMSLAFNGKPVMEDQCLGDLEVKAGAVFVTYRRCPGG